MRLELPGVDQERLARDKHPGSSTLVSLKNASLTACGGDQERPIGRGGLPGAVSEDGHEDLDELPVRLRVQPGRDPGRRRHFLPMAGQTTECIFKQR